MSTTRRNALTMLGLATAASPVVAAEDFFSNDVLNERGGLVTGMDANQALIAAALRNLAAAVDDGRVLLSKLTVGAEVSSAKVLEHTLTATYVVTDVSNPTP